MSETIGGITQPLYNMMREYLPFLLGLLVIILICKLFGKMKSSMKGRKNSTVMSGSTNTWFNWEEYTKRKEDGTVRNDVPQNNKEQFNKKGSLG